MGPLRHRGGPFFFGCCATHSRAVCRSGALWRAERCREEQGIQGPCVARGRCGGWSDAGKSRSGLLRTAFKGHVGGSLGGVTAAAITTSRYTEDLEGLLISGYKLSKRQRCRRRARSDAPTHQPTADPRRQGDRETRRHEDTKTWSHGIMKTRGGELNGSGGRN